MMDGIQKKPAQIPPQTPKLEQKDFMRPQIKRDELYISRQESLENEKKIANKRRKAGFIWKILSLIIASFLLYGGYFGWKAYSISKKMNGQAQQTFAQDVRAFVSPIMSSHELLKGQDSGRVNILLMGAAGQNKPGGNLTDTIMVMSIDTKNNKVALLSLPRDFYVPIPSTNTFTKINSLYPIGIKEGQNENLIKTSVENITGLTINYYLVVDFDGFEKIIDDIGGVNVTSERDIFDPTYPGPNYSYQTFSLSKGFHQLDGATALQYVRERHDDPEGDFGRAKRQQQVIQAAKNKMFSLQTFFNVGALNDVLNTLGDNIHTDISFNEIDSFISLSKKLDLQNITNVVVDAWKPDSLLKVSHVQLGNANAFILVPRAGNYSEIQELAQNVFNQTEIKSRQMQIAAEAATINIVNQSGNEKLASKVRSLLTDRLGIKNVTVDQSQVNNAPVAKTSVSDNSNGLKIFTLDELIKKVPASFSNESANQDQTADITLILGTDILNAYQFDDASVDDFNKAQDTQDNIDFTNIK